MLVLLPPSEGKSPPRRQGRPVNLASLVGAAELTGTRQAVLERLVSLCSGDPDAARQVLGLSAGLVDEVSRNARLPQVPARPAREVYTGVLYDALGLATLSPAAKRRAQHGVLVTSSLWGVLRPGDRIPPYRLSGDVSLPGVGPVAALWRWPLDALLPRLVADGLLLDLRSGTYQAFWRPGPDLAPRTVTVHVLHETRPGDPSSRRVVSHLNKATKGRLLRALLESGARPRTPEQLIGVLAGLGFAVEPSPARSGLTTLDVVVTEL